MISTKVSGELADWPQVFLPINVIGSDLYGTGYPNLSTWGLLLVKGKCYLAESGVNQSWSF